MPDGQPQRRGAWPDHPVIYQVYPRSFADTSGSGVGDLSGIAAHLDHIAELGADAVWIGPIYPSPFVDGGYDVSDYTGIDPRFGTMADLDRLIAQAHARGLRVMLDLVFNHTSGQHPWFAASARRQDGYDDWYVWADADAGGGPPNNWHSFFGPPAWTWHAGRGQYFMHTFLPEQPKLNLRHAAVRLALAQVCAFWRDRGVDGFRMDAVTSYLHDPQLRDNPPARAEVAARIAGPPDGPYTEQDHVHDFLPGDGVAFMNEVRTWVGPDVYLLGEVNSGNQSVELAADLVGTDGLDSAYVVDLAEQGLTGTVLADMVARGACSKGLAWWFSTHDHARHTSRDGDGSARDAAMFGLLLAALPGPLILYQGEELGQRQGDLPAARIEDPFDRRYLPDPPGRDGARVPMAWTDAAPSFGFSTAAPWLPMDTTEAPTPASVQRADPGSVLTLYRKALRLRRDLGLAAASIKVMTAEPDLFVAQLHPPNRAPVTVATNMTQAERPCCDVSDGIVLLSSIRVRDTAVIPARSTLWIDAP